MNAPDKVYVSIGYEAQTKPFHTSVEYIRKDSLLEWAKDWQDELDDSLGASMVHHVLNEVIKKIESL